ncbi:hypothetical protein [Crocosphaera sp. XPORK-15E]|uniref:hypothetical protein n=1 Tax=Crocosphaera sp. XPORK-15E TaxID=3110247 RepID=UPI002B21310B|nr:hypothetical protein [Crocosphaera sp. XPORK-15E]
MVDDLISPVLKFYISTYACLIAWGFLLSTNNSLDNRFLWWVGWLLILTIFSLIFLVPIANSTILQIFKTNFTNHQWLQLNIRAKILVITTVIVIAINLLCAITLYSHNWDSMTYHLARVMYFIQHKNTSIFDTNFDWQVLHPVYSSYLNIAFLMLFNEERSMTLVQYFGGLFAALSVMGISLLISGRMIASFLSGCVFLILTNVNLQMTTTQNDLLMTSFLGCSIYFLLLWIRDRKLIFALYSCLSFVITLGIKANAFLYFFPLLILLLSYLYLSGSIRKIYHLFLIFPLMIAVFFTSGYYQNLIHFGSALGPVEAVNTVSLQNLPFNSILKIGLENLVRFSSKFLSLDGLPPIKPLNTINMGMQTLLIYPFQMIGIDVYNKELVRVPFNINDPAAHEDLSYGGLLGFSILWPLVFITLFNKKLRAFLPLSLGAIFFLLSQSFATLYDPWRGRAFIACAIFMVPISTIIWQDNHKNKILSFLLTLLIIISSFSALTTLTFRQNRHLVPDKSIPSILSMDRIEQLTTNRKNLTEPLKRVTNWIDQYPSLKLYTILHRSFFVYPLFRGNEVIPLNGFMSGFQPGKLNSIKRGILLYSSDIYSNYQIGDIEFGENLFGRVI